MENKSLIYWSSRWNNEGTKAAFETNEFDETLVSFVQGKEFSQSLEIGCGSGINALCISEFSKEVTAIDISSTAIDLAKDRVEKIKKTNLFFEAKDFLEFESEKSYEFIFDRGCFHHVGRSKADQKTFLTKISSLMSDNGYWLSIVGSAESIKHDRGPPRWTMTDIVNSIEPYLKIAEIKECPLNNTLGVKITAWAVVCQKRNYPWDKDENFFKI